MTLTIYSAPATEPGVYPLIAHASTWTALAERLNRADPRLAGRLRQAVAGRDGSDVVPIRFGREEAERLQRMASQATG